jgi:hypothetical protein
MTNPLKALTAADSEALAALPAGEWFAAMHLPINRPQYRCERLQKLGKLQHRVIGEYPHFVSEYRKLPEARDD